MSASKNVTIGTLHVRGTADDTSSLRLALSGMLNSADLLPRGISPSAILIVQSLSDPLPGYLVPQPGVMRIDVEWERAVLSALSSIYHQAARPIGGNIPLNTPAVLFADEGEMLACIALDMSRGEAGKRWWWKLILRMFPSQSSDSLKNLLCSKAIYLPAALHHLSDWGEAIPVIKYLSPEQAVTVISTMSREYSITDFSADIVLHKKTVKDEEKNIEKPQSKMYEYAGGKTKSEGISIRQYFYITQRSKITAQLDRWLPPVLVSHSLGKERTYLLTLGLALYHEPAIVRSGEFLQAISSRWADYETPHYKKKDISSKPLTINRKEPGREEKIKSEAQYPPDKTVAYDPQPSLKESIEEDEFPQDIRSLSTYQGDSINRDTSNHMIESHLSNISQEKKAYLHEEARTVVKGADTILEEGVETQLGGILYLINLMRQLDLPARFEKEWGLASQIGAWGVLEVLGRALLGKNSEDLAGDALWNILAELSGRNPGKLPGDDFHGSDTFRLPINWFNHAAKEGKRYYWAEDHRQLHLWSEKYLLVDCPRDMSIPEAQVRNELLAYLDNADSVELSSRSFDYAPLENMSSYLIDGLNPDLFRWLAMVMPFIRFHLKQTLNAKEPDVEKMLLCQGRLYVTSTHVDFIAGIDNISIHVRLAGLDRDPGWVADFGRVVQFHFE